MILASKDQKLVWQKHGYLVVRDLIPESIIQAVSDGVDGIVERAVRGEFQDPPFRWLDEHNQIPYWMNDLLTPQKYYPGFDDFLAHILPFAESLLGAEARSSWLSLMTCGSGIPYSTPIHRDNNSMGTDEEVPLIEKYLGQQCYIQAPTLPEDRFLEIIPGSHLRPANDEELAAGEVGWEGESLTGMVTVELEPGDIVFRQTNTLHRGWNPKGLPRAILIASFWRAEFPLIDIEMQDYNDLSEPEFASSLTPRTAKAVGRYIEMYKANENENQKDS